EKAEIAIVIIKAFLRSLRFRLWNEKSNNFVSFKEVKNIIKNNVSVRVKSEL
ncbi:TPA: fatty acid desaturase, partial [Bacillus cereus]|nr:fatty acid desaturase [Bacillus cereus]